MDGLRCFIFLFVFGSSSAFADFLIEPYGGGQFSGTNSAESGSTYSSFIYGGRVGLEYSSLSFGGEYLGDNSVDLKVGGPNTWGNDSTSLAMSNTNYGGFLAFEFMQPLAARFVATYFFSSGAHLTHSNGNSIDTDETLSGYGYKGELQARLARYLYLGVGYYYLIYTKTRDNLKNDMSSNVPVDNAHAVMATLSIPLQF
jgi:hypothetical protein